MPGAYLYGWNGAAWVKGLVDGGGRLQVDVIASGLPLGGATAANQATIIGHIDDIEGALGQCYGYDGTNWQTLLVESNVLKNLRVKLYDGANGIDSALLSSVSVPDAARGLVVNSALRLSRAAVGVWYEWRCQADIIDANDGATFAPVGIMGYNGATWDRLRVDAAFRLLTNSMLYDGANAITSSLLDVDSEVSGALRGLHTRSLMMARYSAATVRAIHMGSVLHDNQSLGNTISVGLYGYNGASWDRLRMESAAQHNLRVTLYDGAEQAYVGPTGSDNITVSRNALATQAFLHGFDGTNWDRLRVDASQNLMVNVNAIGATISSADSFGGNVYSKTMTMADDNPTRFEAAAKKLRDVVIIVKTHPMLLGETGVEVYPVGANETVGFTKVDISTLYFQNAGAGNNGVITILGVEE